MSSADPQGLQAFPEALSSREAWLEPFPWYREMRDDEPVRYDSSRRTWDVFRYDDVKRVLDDDDTFSVDLRQANTYQPGEQPEDELIFETMLFQDPPRHGELRGVVEEAFRPSSIGEMEPRIREIADELLTDLAADGTLDVVADLAYPLPVIVIADVLGVPRDDRDRFKQWSDALVASTSAESPSGVESVAEEYQQSLYEMAAYFLEALEERRHSPRDDLLTTISTAEREDGTRLTEQEALGTCILLLVAGNITTTNLITNAVRCFLEEGIDDLQALPSLSAAIEEVLRYRSPIQAMSRVATRDVTLRGDDRGRRSGDRVDGVGEPRRTAVCRRRSLRSRPLTEPAPRFRSRDTLLSRRATRPPRGSCRARGVRQPVHERRTDRRAAGADAQFLRLRCSVAAGQCRIDA